MFNKQELSKFLVEAKKSTYAAGDQAHKIINSDKSTTITYEKDNWKYHDNYFGGEPYGGREVVFYKNKPVYIMTYYGFVDESIKAPNLVYTCLMNALKLIPEDKPFRGPEEYQEENLIYENIHSGEVDNFKGEETIKQNGKLIYKANYMGGFIDQR